MPKNSALLKLPEAEGIRSDTLAKSQKVNGLLYKYLELLYKLKRKKEFTEITSKFPKTPKEHYKFLGLNYQNYNKVKKTNSWAWKYYLLKWQYAQFML